jgi:hypothetical protein
MQMTLRQKIASGLIKLIPVVKTYKEHKANSGLDILYFWQEISVFADNALKESWRSCQERGVIPSDDDMRALGEGEHIVIDSQLFSVLAKVSKPSERFDRDLFIATLVRKYKLNKAKLEAVADSCKVPCKASLSKSVVEAAQ